MTLVEVIKEVDSQISKFKLGDVETMTKVATRESLEAEYIRLYTGAKELLKQLGQL